MEGFFKDIQHLVECKDVSRKICGDQELQEFRSYRSSSATLVRENGGLLAGMML
jgi:hypothetical protein